MQSECAQLQPWVTMGFHGMEPYILLGLGGIAANWHARLGFARGVRQPRSVGGFPWILDVLYGCLQRDIQGVCQGHRAGASRSSGAPCKRFAAANPWAVDRRNQSVDNFWALSELSWLIRGSAGWKEFWKLTLGICAPEHPGAWEPGAILATCTWEARDPGSGSNFQDLHPAGRKQFWRIAPGCWGAGSNFGETRPGSRKQFSRIAPGTPSAGSNF